MNIKGKIVIICFVIAFFFVITKHFFPFLRPSVGYIVSVDTLINDDYKKVVQKVVESYKRITFSKNDLLKAVSSTFPFIRNSSLTVAGYHKKKYTIKIVVHTPLVVVNNQYLLLDNGILVSKDIFKPDIQTLLPLITVADLIQNKSEFCKKYPLFKKNNLGFFDKDFLVEWFNETTILINKKQSHLFTYKIAYDTSFNDSFLRIIENVQEKLITVQQNNLKYKNNEWLLDMRFENRVIALIKKGGIYEKRIC